VRSISPKFSLTNPEVLSAGRPQKQIGRDLIYDPGEVEIPASDAIQFAIREELQVVGAFCGSLLLGLDRHVLHHSHRRHHASLQARRVRQCRQGVRRVKRSGSLGSGRARHHRRGPRDFLDIDYASFARRPSLSLRSKTKVDGFRQERFSTAFRGFPSGISLAVGRDQDDGNVRTGGSSFRQHFKPAQCGSPRRPLSMSTSMRRRKREFLKCCAGLSQAPNLPQR
jgi:hypothetical protein